MAISDEQFAALVVLVQDGELDDRMLELQEVIDTRNDRIRDKILRLVKSVWGQDAQIVNGMVSEPKGLPVVELEQARRSAREAVPYQPDTGPAVPSGTPDPMDATWPSPVQSTASAGEGFAPVADPIGGNLGDGDPNFVSTGAQIG